MTEIMYVYVLQLSGKFDVTSLKIGDVLIGFSLTPMKEFFCFMFHMCVPCFVKIAYKLIMTMRGQTDRQTQAHTQG